jgi:Holliday junction resolvasome RuvABC ATP-dependent DNA helicase subunit
MEEAGRLIEPEVQTTELGFDVSLRPSTLREFIGQAKLKENLSIF